MHRTRIAFAAAAAAVLALTACGAEPTQGTAERSKTSDEKPDADEDSDTKEAKDDQPDTELALGDAFVYNDGVKITVTKMNEITKFGEYDVQPEAGQTVFRVHWDVENGSKKFLDLDAWGYQAQGATTGGDAGIGFVELDSKRMAGRLAAGKTGSYTSEYTLAKEDGKKVVFTMTRIDEEFNLLAKDPNWTGDIK